ncbi:hypothetical protein SAMN04487787_105131 [Kosakonia sacchari]|nr:hypothetical protein SAMN04487787_105131 [Kosakonia sacchari]
MKISPVIFASLFVSIVSGCHSRSVDTSTVSTGAIAPVLSDFDQLQNDLAKRTQTRFGYADDFQVVVSDVNFPIGTLIRVGGSIPVDYSACQPAITPVALGAPSLFPSYTLSKGVAVDAGFDKGVISKLMELGVNVSASDKIRFSVKDTSVTTLADTDLKKTINRAGCREILKESPALIVRGYIEGKRDFALVDTNTGKFNASVEKIGKFSVSGGRDSTLSLTDDKKERFLQIISQIRIIADNSTPQFEKPSELNGIGKIYIQQDKEDKSASGSEILARLKAKGFRTQGVDKMDSRLMPVVTRVRIFHSSDTQTGQTVLHEIQEKYPDAKLELLGLPAKPGTIEIWLPAAR